MVRERKANVNANYFKYDFGSQTLATDIIQIYVYTISIYMYIIILNPCTFKNINLATK